MKLFTNARCLEYKVSGIERYTINLVEKLKNHYDVILLSKNKLDISIKGVRNIYSSGDQPAQGSVISKLIWEMFSCGLLVEKDSLFHSVNTTLPFTLPLNAKAVVTVHDFAYKKFPSCFSFREKFYYKIMNSWSFFRADKIICISESTLKDFYDYYPLFKNKATVIHNGFEDLSVKGYDLNLYGEIKALDYYLVVGTLNKRKNLTRLVEAYTLARERNVTSKKLVIIGDNKNLKNFEKIEGVVITGFISDEKLAAYYANCWCYFFPSLYEGFGFPILEAQSFGKPVMTSNSSSMKEISGYEESSLVDPENTLSIYEFVRKIEKDQGFYESIAEISKENCKSYSWELMANKTIKIMDELFR